MWRDGLLLRSGYPDLALRGLPHRAIAENAGPLECLFAVLALPNADPSPAPRFLETGLAHLRWADEARDLRELIEGDAAGPQLIRQLLRRLAATSEADAARLGAAAGPGVETLVRTTRNALRARTNEPPDRVLLEVVEHGWTNEANCFFEPHWKHLHPASRNPARRRASFSAPSP